MTSAAPDFGRYLQSVAERDIDLLLMEEFPKRVTLNHKNDQGCMDLEFERTTVADLTARRSASWPEGIWFAQTGKSAVLRLPIPSCNMDRALTEQALLVHDAFAAARKLAPLARIMTAG